MIMRNLIQQYISTLLSFFIWLRGSVGHFEFEAVAPIYCNPVWILGWKLTYHSVISFANTWLICSLLVLWWLGREFMICQKYECYVLKVLYSFYIAWWVSVIALKPVIVELSLIARKPVVFVELSLIACKPVVVELSLIAHKPVAVELSPVALKWVHTSSCRTKLSSPQMSAHQ